VAVADAAQPSARCVPLIDALHRRMRAEVVDFGM
jgi:hypothetical protein